MHPDAPVGTRLATGLDGRLEAVAALYRDLHAHPELAFAEHRTAALVAERLTAIGLEVTTGVGGTGVVGVLRNGAGPTVLLRADMDGLPIAEDDTVAHRSRDTGVDADGATVPVMHACGHDTHMAALVGALECLAADRAGWSGTVLAVMQPAEEVGGGSRAMLADGFLERFGPFDVALGQHVTSAPAGHLYARGWGVHGRRRQPARDRARPGRPRLDPHATVDPVVIAAAIVLRLQTIVSREVAPADSVVVTVGSLHAGSKENIIPDRAELKINIRTFDPDVRARVLAAVDRIVRAEAAAAGAPAEPGHRAAHRLPVAGQRRRRHGAGAGGLRDRLRRPERARGPAPLGQRGLRVLRGRRGRALGVLELRRAGPGRLRGRRRAPRGRGHGRTGTRRALPALRAHRGRAGAAPGRGGGARRRRLLAPSRDLTGRQTRGLSAGASATWRPRAARNASGVCGVTSAPRIAMAAPTTRNENAAS